MGKNNLVSQEMHLQRGLNTYTLNFWWVCHPRIHKMGSHYQLGSILTLAEFIAFRVSELLSSS